MPGDFICDNSVAMRWVFPSAKKSDMTYALAVAESIEHARAVVPPLWEMECVNVINKEVAKKIIELQKAQEILAYVADLVMVDRESQVAIGILFDYALRFRISAYDAMYLCLAKERHLPLATLDADLKQAAQEANIAMYYP